MSVQLKFRQDYPEVYKTEALNLYSRLSEKPAARSCNSFGARKVDATAEGGVYEFIGVSEGRKRDGSTIRVPGIDLRALRANPIFMFGHNYSQPPIGRIVDFKRTKLRDESRALAIRVAPLQTQVDTEHTRFANLIFDMIDKGDMRAVSFGWTAVEALPLKDDEGYFTGWDFVKSDALEFSAVPIPADPSALITAIRSRGLGDEVMDRFVTRASENNAYILREISEEQEWDAETDPPANNERVAAEPPANDVREILTRVQSLVEKVAGIETNVVDMSEKITDLETRKGAVLNAANRKALVDAATLIATVLKNASTQEDTTTADKPANQQSVQSVETRDAENATLTADEVDTLKQWVAQRDLQDTAKQLLGQMARKRATQTASSTTNKK